MIRHLTSSNSLSLYPPPHFFVSLHPLHPSHSSFIMTGGPSPYSIPSPTQQQRYSMYSPNKSYYNDPPPPYHQQAPSPFSQHRPTLAGSPPRFAHPSSPLSTTLPPLNGSIPPAPPPSLPHPSTPHHQLPVPRPYATVLPGNGHVPFSQHHVSPPGHTHPVPLFDHHDPGLSNGLAAYPAPPPPPQLPMMRDTTRNPSPSPPEQVRLFVAVGR